MNILIEYKDTSKSKFTFTIEEVRIKVAEKDRHLITEFSDKATTIYEMLICAGWTGITLRGNALCDDNLRLNDSYKNKIASLVKDTIVWESEKGTRKNNGT